MERRRSVQHHLQPGGLDDLVKGVGLRDVGHDGHGQRARGGLGGVRLADLGGFVLGADGRYDSVAFGEELLEDVRWWEVLVCRVSWSVMAGGWEWRGRGDPVVHPMPCGPSRAENCVNLPAMKPEPPVPDISNPSGKLSPGKCTHQSTEPWSFSLCCV